MIATSHLIIGGSVGVIVGSVTQNPALALAAGFASHLICDSLPHLDHPPAPKIDGELVWTKPVWIFAYADSIFGGLLTLLIWGFQFNFDFNSMFLWGAIGGYLPDFIDNVPYWKHQVRKLTIFKQFHRFHEWIHKNWEAHYPMPKHWVLGIVSQLVFVVPALWLIFR